MSVQSAPAVGQEPNGVAHVVPAPPSSDLKIADPGPLGLGAFALTTFILSMSNAELARGAGEPIVFGLP